MLTVPNGRPYEMDTEWAGIVTDALNVSEFTATTMTVDKKTDEAMDRLNVSTANSIAPMYILSERTPEALHLSYLSFLLGSLDGNLELLPEPDAFFGYLPGNSAKF